MVTPVSTMQNAELARMGANDYLQLRRGRWFARIRLPADLARSLGRTHIVRSLGTSDLTVARQGGELPSLPY